MKTSKSKWLFAGLPFLYHWAYEEAYGAPNPRPLPDLPRIHSAFDDIYLKEETFKEDMLKTALPYIKARESSGYLKGPSRLRCAIYRADQPRATITISHGFGESLPRYQEMIYYFLKMGCDVFFLEHFGHGQSSRGPKDREYIWVDDFDRYSRDYDAFLKKVVLARLRTRPLIHYAHSMGGAILARSLQVHGNQGDGIIFSTPMFRLLFGVAESIVHPIAKWRARPLKSKKVSYQGVIDRRRQKLLPAVPATHSKARRDYFYQAIEGILPIATWSWLHESLKATHEIMKPENIRKLDCPVLLLQAQEDFYVSPVGHWLFVREHPNCQAYRVPGSYHEIYSETDDILTGFYNCLEAFISEIVEKHDAN